MNSAKEVAALIQSLKDSGIQKSEAAWKAARACEGWPYIYGLRGDYDTPIVRERVYEAYPKYTGLVKNCQVLNEKTGSCDGCQWYPDGSRVRGFDCRGFTYWILLQIYGWKLMGSGATSQWNTESNWKAKGTIDTIPEDQLVCLFYPEKDNPKVMAHTGFGYKGETVECSNGVQHFKTRNKKWTHWALPACVDGDIQPTPDPEPEPKPEKKPTIRRGDKGPYVKECQEDLIRLGYDVGKTGADGIFGKNTEAGVKAFQKDHNDRDGKALKVDGIVGEKTWGALDDAIGKIGT